jgi:hypothetical protein
MVYRLPAGLRLTAARVDDCRGTSAIVQPLKYPEFPEVTATADRASEVPDYQRPPLRHHWWCLWTQTDQYWILERLFDGVPDRVNELSDTADDALALRSLIGTSHQTIHALSLPVLPLLEGFGNGIVSSLVSAPGLP